MGLQTIPQGLVPRYFQNYLRAIDGLQCGFSLTPTNIFQDGRLEFELWVDGGDHNGTKVMLWPDGTWTVRTEIVIGETPCATSQSK